MTTVRRYNYSSDKQISALVADETNGFLWIAYKQNSDGYCILKKVSRMSPDQLYFSVNIEVDEISSMKIDGSYIYLSFNDDTYIGGRYILSNPLLSPSLFNIPSGITEEAVDVVVDGSDLFYLIPGVASGTNTKIVKMSLSGTFDETIDLATVNNAVSFAVDTSSNLWLVTNTIPADLVRVYDPGSGYIYSVTIMT